MPATNPPSTSTPRPNTVLGRSARSRSQEHEAPGSLQKPAAAFGSSSLATRCRAAQDRVDVDEIVADRRIGHALRHVALGAEESPRRDRGEELTVTVHEMRDRDHWRLRFAGSGSRMAGQALVAPQIDLVAIDRMRNHRRLFRIVPRLPVPRCCASAPSAPRPLLIERSRAARPESNVCAASMPVPAAIAATRVIVRFLIMAARPSRCGRRIS